MADATQEKPVKSLAERQRDAMIGTEETIQRFKELGIGALKAVTTDIPGFLADIADKLAGDTATLGEKDRSSQMFKAITGIESKGTNTELLGSLLGPESAVKAMVVGAAKLARTGKVSTLEHSYLTVDGMSKPYVFNSTGVYTDIDFSRKAVISDLPASINYEKLSTPGNVGSLSEFISHPEFFKLYPEMKDYTVITKSGKGATFYPGRKEINIGTDYSASQQRGVLLHEMQHAVQSAEGFKLGGTPKSFMDYPADQVYNVLSKLPPPKAESVKNFRDTVKAKARNDYLSAYQRYQDLPGEQEARFTQANQFLSEEELNSQVQKLLNKGATPSNQTPPKK